MKVVLLNEVIIHPLFKPNFNIEYMFYSFKICQYPYYLIRTTFYNSHAIKMAPRRQI
jgi:hypothetical protein